MPKRFLNIALYVVGPLIAAIAPMIAYPAITSTYGASGFAAIAIGQSVGGSIGAICELGWGVVGPQLVARSDSAGRTRIFYDALLTKGIVLILGLPAAAVLSLLLAPDHGWSAAVVGIALGSTALSSQWYFVGMNSPGRILLYESLPRLALIVISAVLIQHGGPLLLYGIALLVAQAIATVLAAVRVGQRRAPLHIGQSFRALAEHLPLTVGRAVSVLYTMAPVALVGAIAPFAVPAFAAVDRLNKLGLSFLAVVPLRLQSWLGVRQGRRAQHKVVLICATVGFLAVPVILLGYPIATEFLFRGTIESSMPMMLLSALMVVIVCTSRGLGLLMVARGRANQIAVSNVVAAVVGLVVMVLFIGPLGGIGALFGMVAAEAAGALVQFIVLRRTKGDAGIGEFD